MAKKKNVLWGLVEEIDGERVVRLSDPDPRHLIGPLAEMRAAGCVVYIEEVQAFGNPLKNPNCDNDKCQKVHGEVRLLPTGGDGNAILCKTCYRHESAWRRQRNKELEESLRFDLPTWESLRVYEG